MKSNLFCRATSDSIFHLEEPLPYIQSKSVTAKILASCSQALPVAISHSDCTVHNKSSASPFVKYEGPRVILPSMLSCVTQQRFKEVIDSGFRHSDRTTVGIKTSRTWAASSSEQFIRDCIVLDYQQMCHDFRELLWHSED